jgi:large subunit ribosomal protein L29
MKASEIRDLSTDAIRTRLNDSQEELMRLRFQQATGELTDHSRVRQVRRRIARLLTILRERQQAARMEGE